VFTTAAAASGEPMLSEYALLLLLLPLYWRHGTWIFWSAWSLFCMQVMLRFDMQVNLALTEKVNG
jgi:hypothetical protein